MFKSEILLVKKSVRKVRGRKTVCEQESFLVIPNENDKIN